MTSEVTSFTLSRGLQSVSAGDAIQKGGDYLKNHGIKEFFLWLVSFGNYTDRAYAEIGQKGATLARNSDVLTKSILEAKPDANGNYNFQTTIQNTDNSQTNFVITYNNAQSNITTISNSNNPDDLEIIHDFSINDLKKPLLNHYLNKHRKVDDVIELHSTTIDLYALDDLSGVNPSLTA